MVTVKQLGTIEIQMIEFNHAKNASPAFLSGEVPSLALPEQYDDMASLPKAICE